MAHARSVYDIVLCVYERLRLQSSSCGLGLRVLSIFESLPDMDWH